VPLRIGVLSKGLQLYSTQRLFEACRKAQIEPILIDPRHCLVLSNTTGGALLLDGKGFPAPDALIPRVGTEDAAMSIAVLRHLEARGSVSINPSHAIELAKDKYASIQCLAGQGLPVPETVYLKDPFQFDRAFELLGDPPYVLKLPEGAQGIGVLIAESKSSAESMVDAIWRLGSDVLIQQFVAGSYGQDIRVFVLGTEIVSSVRRTAKNGRFRSNVHLGAEVASAELSTEQRNLALKSAEIHGLNMAGVDLAETSDGRTLVLEVNASPGLEGVERATGLDVAGQIVNYVANRCRNKRTADPGSHSVFRASGDSSTDA
jgi:ribosomal protein S6--L-glutamate ligase